MSIQADTCMSSLYSVEYSVKYCVAGVSIRAVSPSRTCISLWIEFKLYLKGGGRSNF